MAKKNVQRDNEVVSIFGDASESGATEDPERAVRVAHEKSLTHNVTGKAHCTWCCNQALITVGVEQRSTLLAVDADKDRKVANPTVDVEITGPCFKCEKGWKVDLHLYEGKFWDDRSADWLEPECDCRKYRDSMDALDRKRMALREASAS